MPSADDAAGVSGFAASQVYGGGTSVYTRSTVAGPVGGMQQPPFAMDQLPALMEQTRLLQQQQQQQTYAAAYLQQQNQQQRVTHAATHAATQERDAQQAAVVLQVCEWGQGAGMLAVCVFGSWVAFFFFSASAHPAVLETRLCVLKPPVAKIMPPQSLALTKLPLSLFPGALLGADCGADAQHKAATGFAAAGQHPDCQRDHGAVQLDECLCHRHLLSEAAPLGALS